MQVKPVELLPMLQPGDNAQKQENVSASFSTMFNNAMKKLHETEIKSDSLSRDLLTGDIQDIHQVTIAMQETKLTMQLAIEVRNKVVEAYQEISRMQV